MPALEVQGRPASGGNFAGPIVYLGQCDPLRRQAGTPAEEETALEAAIGAAIADIGALSQAGSGAIAEMLAFQIAMLEDDALRLPAWDAIGAGTAADVAWREVMDREAEGYALSDDEFFRARAIDLKDMRDRVLHHLAGHPERVPTSGVVLAGEDLAPTAFLEADWSRGGAIALAAGSPTSHVAMLARSRGIPMVVGLGTPALAGHQEALVDGSEGKVIFDPGPRQRQSFMQQSAAAGIVSRREAEFLFRPTRLKDGSVIELLINVAGLDDLDHVDARCCDGIGLMRSEFLFRDGAALPDEEAQLQAYRRLLEWADGRPVTVRTLDAGGDKPIGGLTPEKDRNPFLGLRGVRLTLSRPDVFRTQLRALARAAALGPLKIMLPMVSQPDEIERSAGLLDRCIAELTAEGADCARPPLGIMVEVPAVAVAPELYLAAQFFSIGTNDLTQYLMAAARDDEAVAHLNDPAHPAVTRLIAGVTAFAATAEMPVSLCGDMASEPAHLRMLVDAGLRSLSVAPARVAKIKAALAEL